MREELDKKLVAKYPKIFAGYYGDMRETCMCWGFECGDGWYNIIDQLCNNIQTYIDQNTENVEQVIATQVKEKLGTLRFYYQGGDDHISEMVDETESASSITCDVCGAPASCIRHRGWLQTRCNAHI